MSRTISSQSTHFLCRWKMTYSSGLKAGEYPCWFLNREKKDFGLLLDRCSHFATFPLQLQQVYRSAEAFGLLNFGGRKQLLIQQTQGNSFSHKQITRTALYLWMLTENWKSTTQFLSQNHSSREGKERRIESTMYLFFSACTSKVPPLLVDNEIQQKKKRSIDCYRIWRWEAENCSVDEKKKPCFD